jgi:DNA-binding XRE family transcriptional regulator
VVIFVVPFRGCLPRTLLLRNWRDKSERAAGYFFSVQVDHPVHHSEQAAGTGQYDVLDHAGDVVVQPFPLVVVATVFLVSAFLTSRLPLVYTGGMTLKQMRQQRCLTEMQMAARLGMSRAGLRKVESGATTTTRTIQAYAAALGISAAAAFVAWEQSRLAAHRQ